MKFIREDGTIEEGTLVREDTFALREQLREYLHGVVCNREYHPDSVSVPPCAKAATFLATAVAVPSCAKAATFLAMAVNDHLDDPTEYAVTVEDEVYRLTHPKPEQSTLPAASAATTISNKKGNRQ